MQTTLHTSHDSAVIEHPSSRYRTDMHSYLRQLVQRLGYPEDKRHRYVIVAHLFDDTLRMLEALEPVIEYDAIVGVPYSSNRSGVASLWSRHFGEKVHIPNSLDHMERMLIDQLAQSLSLCRQKGQRLIVQDVGGFVAPLLHNYFADQLHLVKGIVEITKQGVWRAEAVNLAVPVLHCADSEMKRLEARRCGETIARCLDGVARRLGLSLAGRFATVFGAGWIGSGVASALGRLDMVPALIDCNPLRVAEARLQGFAASRQGNWLEASHLVVGATGKTSITRNILERLPNNAIVASGSSRQLEIDIAYLQEHPSVRVGEGVEAFHLRSHQRTEGIKTVLLVNDGFPANFMTGSGSVPDEIVETILGELIVLMCALSDNEFSPGVHPITPEQESLCAELWLELRDGATAPCACDPALPPRADTSN